MRRSIVLAAFVALLELPAAASAKLASFGFEANPVHPRAGEPITITMTCYFDRNRSRPMSSCFGNEGIMAWVHPLDDEGEFDRDDWIAVYGHPTPAGASQGRIVLDDPGPYDVMPLWRRWSDRSIRGLPGVLRIEVAGDAPLGLGLMDGARIGSVGALVGAAAWRRASRTKRASTCLRRPADGSRASPFPEYVSTMKVLAASLAVALLTACGSVPEENAPEPLDERAKVACAAFDKLAADYESLDEDERRDLVFEMWDGAQFSETTGIRRIGRKVVEVVAEDKVATRAKVFDDMRLACRGLASPYRTIGSND